MGAQPSAPPASVAELRDRIDTLLSAPRFSGAAWGIQAVSLDTGATLYETNALRLLKPASNNKIFTAALALDRFGADHRIRTSFLARKLPGRTGIIRGDVIVVGRGDPSFAARFNDGDYARSLAPLADALVQAGVRRIEGGLVGDESFFRGPPFGSTWAWDDLQYYYGAEVSALSAEDNTLDLVVKPGLRLGLPCLIESKPAPEGVRFENLTRTVPSGGVRKIDIARAPGSDVIRVSGTLPLGDKEVTDAVTVPRPALLFLRLLKAELKRRGITVTGRVRAVDAAERARQPLDALKYVEIAHAFSRPMSELVLRMMKPSQNLYAQLLFLQAGEARRLTTLSEATSEELGLEALESFVEALGIPPSEVLLEEGSGLSRGALVTPHAIVSLLRGMDRHPQAPAFRESFPVAGVDGSLRQRMKNTPAAGVLRAKTGTLRYVNALSGYTTTAGGERVAFSILLNNYRPPAGASGRDEVDAVAVLLHSLTARTGGGR
jgi:D-alanyl-D-alanine carboxypeptidase/D-alanyl-D-alanine-endopeptidase (penicillin-binding protein 4)